MFAGAPSGRWADRRVGGKSPPTHLLLTGRKSRDTHNSARTINFSVSIVHHRESLHIFDGVEEMVSRGKGKWERLSLSSKAFLGFFRWFY